MAINCSFSSKQAFGPYLRSLMGAALLCLLNIAAASESLCADSEEIFFSCKVPPKIVSLCASTDLSARSGWLQYRFGLDRDHIELEYPAKPTHPRESFIEQNQGSAKAHTGILGFTRYGYSYSIFVARSSFGYNGAGVIVSKHGKNAKLHECKRETVNGDALFYRGGGLDIAKGEVDFPPPW